MDNQLDKLLEKLDLDSVNNIDTEIINVLIDIDNRLKRIEESDK